MSEMPSKKTDEIYVNSPTLKPPANSSLMLHVPVGGAKGVVSDHSFSGAQNPVSAYYCSQQKMKDL